MNRRRFIQSFAAAFTLPAAPKLALGSVGTAAPTAAVVPTQARFWAIYMSALHGECTPQTLQNLLHIPEVDSKRYISQLIADGVIKPNPLLKNAVSELAKSKDESVAEKIKKRFQKKKKAKSLELEVQEDANPVDALDQVLDDDQELSDKDVETHFEEQPVDLEVEAAVTTSFEDGYER